MRRFRLIRSEDISGVSGTGLVADGVIFDDGIGALHWLGRYNTVTVHPGGVDSIEAIHGHNGATKVEWID